MGRAHSRCRYCAPGGGPALVHVSLRDRAAEMSAVETIVVGGGPAGAATACRLAAAGRDVVLLERAAGPHHKVCGEFLSIETQAILRRLGVDPLAHGAVPVDRVAIHVGRREVARP